MDGNAILKIPLDQPERIFPNSEDETKKLFRSLAQEWHPDHNGSPNAQKVQDHLQKLYDLVIDKIRSGAWRLPGSLVLKGEDGKERTIKYRKKRLFELGEMVYGDRVICYVVRPDATDLFGRAMETIKHSFIYKDKKMQDEVEKYLPAVLDSFKTKDGSNVLVLAKTPDVFMLQDVIDACNGAIEPKHVAWIMSAFHNIACYMRFAGLTHNAISTTTCFISPSLHSGMLYGGWWYSQMVGKKLIALPKMSVDLASDEMMKKKFAHASLDLSLIRQMGLNCLGDSTGARILHDKDVPKPMVYFLRGSSEGNAFEDYKHWQEKTLINSFGKRSFVEMKIGEGDVYKE